MLHMNQRRRAIFLSAFALALANLIGGIDGAHGQAAYPAKPVRLIVSYPPGGTSDLVGRVVAEEMGRRLGQNFIVENRAGAGGQIGTDLVAKAAPDGYTILVAASGPISYLPALSDELPYDVEKDFATVGNIVTVPNLMVVSANSSIKSIKDLVAHAKQNPGQVNFGSAGVGSSGHITGELLNLLSGIRMVHIPFKGSGPALVGLISGQIEVMFENLPSALTQVRGGKLRGIAVLSPKRSPGAPEFPSTAEVGMPDFVIASSTGLLVPSGTPGAVIALLEKNLHVIATDPAAIRKLSGFGADIDYLDAAQYRRYMRDEIQKWKSVGQRASIAVN
jgi:tripartite-type tricarboxylate transporter receptor subunit TctC